MRDYLLSVAVAAFVLITGVAGVGCFFFMLIGLIEKDWSYAFMFFFALSLIIGFFIYIGRPEASSKEKLK